MLGRAALVLGSVLVSLLLLELGCRLWRGPSALVDWSNIILAERQATRDAGSGRMTRDSELGFVTRPGFTGDGVTYDRHGHRLTPAPRRHGAGRAPRARGGRFLCPWRRGDRRGDLGRPAAAADRPPHRQCRRERLRPRPDRAARREGGARAEAGRAGAGVHRRGLAAQRDEPSLGRGEAVLRTGGRDAHAAQRPRPALAAAGRDARPLAAPVRLVGAGRHDPAPQGLAVRMVDRPCPRAAARRRRGHGLPPAEAAGRPRRSRRSWWRNTIPMSGRTPTMRASSAASPAPCSTARATRASARSTCSMRSTRAWRATAMPRCSGPRTPDRSATGSRRSGSRRPLKKGYMPPR